MFNDLTEKEIKVATKLIDIGLSKAATALQSILNTPISIKAIDFSILNSDNSNDFCTKTDENTHLLKTILIGELKGICHLIFSQEEVAKVYSTCLPESVITDKSELNDQMKKEFLTEIDNIVAAAAITQFSNFLELNNYGGVPSLHVMDSKVVNKYIIDESDSLRAIIKFKAHFHAPELDILPDFIWLLHDDFISKIKNLANGPKSDQLLV